MTKFHNTTEKTNGTIFAQGAGLNASASFSADEEIMKKIQNETELRLSLILELKLDDVKLTVNTIVGNVDKSDFEEKDNVTVCFGESKDCQTLLQLSFYDTFEKLKSTTKKTTTTTKTTAKTTEITTKKTTPKPTTKTTEITTMKTTPKPTAKTTEAMIKKITVHVNNIEPIEVKIEGDVTPLFFKWMKNEPYQTKLTVDAHLEGKLKISIELHGNTTKDDIKKLDDDGEIFDGDILNGLTQLKGEMCIGAECATFKECSENLCNHHNETKPKIPTKKTTTTTKTTSKTTEITTKKTTPKPIDKTTEIKTKKTTPKPTTNTTENHKNHKNHNNHNNHKHHNNHKNHKDRKNHNNHKTSETTKEKPKQDKNETARGFGYFCLVVIILVTGGLVFYYYRKKKLNGVMSARSEYAELTETHI